MFLLYELSFIWNLSLTKIRDKFIRFVTVTKKIIPWAQPLGGYITIIPGFVS